MSSGVYYVAFVQQRRTDSGLPRDREPCLAHDVTGAGAPPGYHMGRLAGSHSSLPVYEIVPSTGPVDSVGPPGPQGPQGVPGTAGPTGSTGDPGTMGTPGPQGPAGPTGSTGNPGTQGTTGPQGPAGPAGSCAPCGSSAPSLICGLLLELPGYNGGVQQILGHDSSGNCKWYDVETC